MKRNQEHIEDGPREPKKPLPLSWVIIAILLYLLFQVSYLALKPIPRTVGMDYRYDRTRWQPEATGANPKINRPEIFPPTAEQPLQDK